MNGVATGFDAHLLLEIQYETANNLGCRHKKICISIRILQR